MILYVLTLIATATATPNFPPDNIEVSLRAAPVGDIAREIEIAVANSEGDNLDLYQWLHQNPELSLHENESATRVASELGRIGFDVDSGVGGTGVVATLVNGEGPTLMIRGDMDALPITENTGLPYASTVTAMREDGSETGVMHACGHDVHMTVLVATGRLLMRLREHWSGTLMLVAQPAEELGLGAVGMIEDGLFERFPSPDNIIGLHVSPEMPAGTVGFTPGWANANVDTVEITVHGRGGHGARPQQSNDPVVSAAAIVMNLQTIVSRRLSPQDPGVITVGSLHAGTKSNIIPDTATMALTVRSYSEDVRTLLLNGIEDVALGTCEALSCEQPPDIEIKEGFTPAAYNHLQLTEVASSLFVEILGEDAVSEYPPSMGGEDFGRYSRSTGRPAMMYRLGAGHSRDFNSEGVPTRELPSLHSSQFFPDAVPTISTGVTTMSNLAIRLLGTPQ
jgi:amidohydrolase